MSYRLRGSIGFLNVEKKFKSKWLYLTQNSVENNFQPVLTKWKWPKKWQMYRQAWRGAHLRRGWFFCGNSMDHYKKKYSKYCLWKVFSFTTPNIGPPQKFAKSGHYSLKRNNFLKFWGPFGHFLGFLPAFFGPAERPQMTLKHFPWVYYMIKWPLWGHSGTHGGPKMAQNSTEMARMVQNHQNGTKWHCMTQNDLEARPMCILHDYMSCQGGPTWHITM